MHKNHEPEVLLERAEAQIRNGRPDAERAEAAAARVWQRLAGTAGATVAEDDYEGMIPAYLAGTLPSARLLLFEDRLRESVTLRRAVAAAREGRPATQPVAEPAAQAEVVPFSRRALVRWALAAMLIVGVGLGVVLVQQWSLFGSSASAEVQTVDGNLFRVEAASHVPIVAGAEIREGDVIRTGRVGGAVVRLNDGSLVELRERSEMAIDEGRRGTTLQLDRGSVIVQAAEQRQRHLYVSTEDCLVSVTGTIFAVDHGTKGSRVSVIEGEVVVEHGGEDAVLQRGDQLSTQTYLAHIGVGENIAWSRDVDHYLQLLGEYRDLKREIRESIAGTGLRYSSRLLDLAPATTTFYVALPNLSERIAEVHQLMQTRLAESEVLTEWWQGEGSHQLQPKVEEIVGKLSQLGDYLGEELVVIGSIDELGDFAGPLALAEIESADGVRAMIEAEVESHGAELRVVFVDNPLAPPAAAAETLFVWLSNDLLVASPRVDDVRQVASLVLEGAANPFIGSELYESIAALYSEGAEILIAADLEGAFAASIDESSEVDEDFAALGLLDAKHLMLEQKTTSTTTQHRAVLSFTEARRGMASWLAAPAPMGALEFISPEAKVVGGFVFKDPVALLDDIDLMTGGTGFGDGLRSFEERYGVSLREDIAGALGGEMAFAIDGALIPRPAWKMILEVYDPARFQWALEQGLAEANVKLHQEGKPPLELTQEQVGGRTFYALPTELLDVHYTFVHGYLVMAPERVHLDRAIRYQSSGYTITDAPRFAALLPADGRNNFSALIYQDLSSVVKSIAERIAAGDLTEDQRQAIAALEEDARPTLGYAYGEEQRIIVAASTEDNMLSTVLMQMLGMRNPAGIEELLAEATRGIL